jgi:hypothetical protein
LDDGVPIAYAASEDKVSPLLLLESDPIIAMAPQLMIRILMPSGKILQYRIMSLKDNVPWQNMISRNGTSLNKWGRWAIVVRCWPSSLSGPIRPRTLCSFQHPA